MDADVKRKMEAFEPTLTFRDVYPVMDAWYQASKRWCEIVQEGRIDSYAEFTGIMDAFARAYSALRFDPEHPAHRQLRQALVKAEETREQIDAAQRRLARVIARETLRRYSGREQSLPEPEDDLIGTVEHLVGFKPEDGEPNLCELRRALVHLPPHEGRAVSLWSDGELAELVGRAETAVFAHLGRPKENYVHQPRFYPCVLQVISLIRDISQIRGQAIWSAVVRH